MTLDEHDVVKVRSLRVARREVEGSPGICRQPLIGDVGTVVNVLDCANFLIECVDDDGATIWLSDFHRDELELIQICRPR